MVDCKLCLPDFFRPITAASVAIRTIKSAKLSSLNASGEVSQRFLTVVYVSFNPEKVKTNRVVDRHFNYVYLHIHAHMPRLFIVYVTIIYLYLCCLFHQSSDIHHILLHKYETRAAEGLAAIHPANDIRYHLRVRGQRWYKWNCCMLMYCLH